MRKLKLYFYSLFSFFILFFVGLCVATIYFASQEAQQFLALFFYFNMLFWLFLCVTGFILYFKYLYKEKLNAKL
ncbi:hypothetical protein C6B37_01955 [Candidatus Phytoplasma phoenicium]|uniref:Uncharacterized protein n=1 Tax=Candidatus Phytoplasma phoenicium TaxID=198422 RepID=A0A2S8NTS4_9MOLU|nr:hypothetical protein C6B37_02620 [Candidatus Phytoplasma phoenicium]PQP79397.1 hypothetical protein C6B37_01955 [Candidatus Phytoplasma phoenicium]